MRRKPFVAVGMVLVAAAACSSERASDAPAIGVAAIDSIPSPAGPGSAEPNLSVAPDGRVYMSWLETGGAGHALRFAVLDGTHWSPAQTIRTGGDFFVNWADFPSIEVLDGGRLAAHWLQRTGTGTYAYGVRISQSGDGGKTWSAPLTPHRDSSQTEHGFVAMWRDQAQLGAVWLDGRKFSKEGHDASERDAAPDDNGRSRRKAWSRRCDSTSAPATAVRIQPR